MTMNTFPITGVTRIDSSPEASRVGLAQEIIELLPTNYVHLHSNKELLDKLEVDPNDTVNVVALIPPLPDTPVW